MKVTHSSKSDSPRPLYRRHFEQGGVLLKVLGGVAVLAVLAIVAIIVLVPGPTSGPSTATAKASAGEIYPAYFYAGGKLLPDAFLDSEFTVLGKKIAEEKVPVRRFLEIFFGVPLNNGQTREFKGWSIADNDYTLRFAGKDVVDRVTFTHVLSAPTNGAVTWFFVKDATARDSVQYVMQTLLAYSEAFPDVRWNRPLPVESKMTGTKTVSSATPEVSVAKQVATAASDPGTAQVESANNSSASVARVIVDPDGPTDGGAVNTRYGKLSVTMSGGSPTLMIGNTRLDAGKGSVGLAMKQKFTMGADDIVLVDDATSAGCTLRFFVIVSSANAASLSPSFGSCGDTAEIKPSGTVILINLRNGGDEPIKYRFDGKNLFENGQLLR